ncbi:MAG: hypothetical protein C0485_09960 [Pirellula sp.]|nr:hypothetical protein [Pirellula sp.]
MKQAGPTTTPIRVGTGQNLETNAMVGAPSNTRQAGRGIAGGDRRNRQSAPTAGLPAIDAAGLKLIGIVFLSEINGDMLNRISALERVRPDDFADPALGEIWSALKAIHGRGEPITPDRVTSLVRPNVRDVGAILGEALTGVYRAITTTDAAFYAQQVIEASHARRGRLILHDAARILAASPSAVDAMRRVQNEVSALVVDHDSRQPSPTSMFDRFEKSILDREKPIFWECAPYGSKLREVKVGAGQVVLIGAVAGNGKTALALQLVVDALRDPNQTQLKALVANVEMSPEALLTRQLARLSGVGHAWLLHRDYDESATSRIREALDELRAVMPRLELMGPPFNLERLAERAIAFAADIVVVDYAQRFDFADRSPDPRAQTGALMDICRRIADQGRAVVVISALNRASYGKEAGLGSFRESSELEYGADSAWLLAADPDDRGVVTLRCLKNRSGQLTDFPLLFDGSLQAFSDDRRSEVWDGGFPDE